MIGVGTFQLAPNAKKYVNTVLDTGRLSYGPFLQKFERLFAASHDCRFSVMTNSGTSSLLVALTLLKTKYGWQDGDEVIVPAVTFIATSNVVLQCNLKPVFVDVDPIFYEIDPALIEKAITPKTRCIIPVHLFGCPCDMDPILDIAKCHDLRIIEDSCESMFVKNKERSVGSFGDIGCFSTYVAHILTTGVGGICTTNDPELATSLRSIVNHGRDSIYLNIDDDKNKHKNELKLIVKKRFSFVQMGHSFRLTEMEGALGLAEFENHEENLLRRKENARFLSQCLKPFEDQIQLPAMREEGEHAFMMYPIVCRNEKKDRLVETLESSGIETRDMLPLTNQPYYKERLGLVEEDYPVAKWINESGFYIGSHHGLKISELEYMGEIFQDFFAQKKLKLEKTCLVIFSKTKISIDPLILDKFLESIQLQDIEEIILLEASRHQETAEFFKNKGITVIQEQEGKGYLLRKAVNATHCENIVTMGIDGTDNPEDIGSIAIRLKQGRELVIGSRFIIGGARAGSRIFAFHSLGNRIFNLLLSVAFGRNISDCNNIFRGFKKRVFEKLDISETGDAVMFQMTLNAMSQGCQHDEVATQEQPSFVSVKKRNRIISGIHFLWIFATSFLKSRSKKKEILEKKKLRYGT